MELHSSLQQAQLAATALMHAATRKAACTLRLTINNKTKKIYERFNKNFFFYGHSTKKILLHAEGCANAANKLTSASRFFCFLDKATLLLRLVEFDLLGQTFTREEEVDQGPGIVDM